MLARSKLNSIENKVSDIKALISNKISHDDFMTVITEKKKLSRIKRKHQNDEKPKEVILK